jgi:hypothetical protein
MIFAGLNGMMMPNQVPARLSMHITQPSQYQKEEAHGFLPTPKITKNELHLYLWLPVLNQMMFPGGHFPDFGLMQHQMMMHGKIKKLETKIPSLQPLTRGINVENKVSVSSCMYDIRVRIRLVDILCCTTTLRI